MVSSLWESSIQNTTYTTVPIGVGSSVSSWIGAAAILTGAFPAVTSEVQQCKRTLTWLTEYHKQLEISPCAPLVQPVCRQIPADSRQAAATQQPSMAPDDCTRDWSTIELAAEEGMRGESLTSVLASVLLQHWGPTDKGRGPQSIIE